MARRRLQTFDSTAPVLYIDDASGAIDQGGSSTAAGTVITGADGAPEIDLVSGAIAVKKGLVIITKAGVAAMTLALPVAGAQSAGGDDGKMLRIISATAQAHTVTTPAAGYNAASTIATFAAAIGNGILLVAKNGTWLVAQSLGITLS